MSVERKILFPEEPIRQISNEPTQAAENSQDRDGQLYFWDNILSFPQSWTIPNKQIRVLPQLSLPKTLVPPEIKDKKPIEKPKDKQIHFWDELAIPIDYIKRNQEFWAQAQRGIGSRPMELVHTEELFHTAMQRVFREYGLSGAVKPIFTFAVFADAPRTASSIYPHKERYLKEIAEEDRQDFLIGMIRLNEYATNYATKEFLIQSLNFPGLREGAKIYSGFANLFTYGVLLRGTFARMRELEIMANHNKKDYKHALLTALFQHDNSELNEIIAMGSEYTGYSNVNELAIEIGRKRYRKPDLGKWFDKLDASRSDGKIKTKAKNGILSSAAMGVYRNPGVIETHGAILPASPIIAGIGSFALIESFLLIEHNINALLHPEHVLLILQQLPSVIPENAAAISAFALTLLPFIMSHEAIHHYSADEQHMGLIPTKVIKKEVTPYKSRFETD